MILFLGLVTSYEDLRYGKIRNKWIFIAIVYGIAANSILFFLNYYESRYLARLILNSLIALFVGILVWRLALWTAGDAKLFFAYSLLLPLDVYWNISSSLFPSISIVSNAFVPFALFILLSSLSKILLGRQFHYFKNLLKFKEIIQSILFVFAFGWLADLLLVQTGFNPSTVLNLIVLVLLSNIFRLLNFNLVIASLPVALLRFLFDKEIFSVASLKHYLLVLAIFVFIKSFVLNFGYAYMTKDVKISSLRKGMIPAENIIKSGKKFKKVKNTSLFFRLSSTQAFFKNEAKGLSSESISKIRKITKNFDIKSIKIHETISFSPFLFLSVLIIIFLNFLYK